MKWVMFLEIGIRVILWFLFIWVECSEPFIREIKQEELWQYQYHATTSYVSSVSLWSLILLTPTIVFMADYMLSRRSDDCRTAFCSLTLAYGLNGFITAYLKVIVGRPRPDFFLRCFPDGTLGDLTKCTGNRKTYLDGRKSFPSGHSSFSFTCMTFICFYMARKFKLFHNASGVKSWQICVCLFPILIATTVAVSRTCDYHHHYTDVIAGSILGTVISYLVFSLYFPKNHVTNTT